MEAQLGIRIITLRTPLRSSARCSGSISNQAGDLYAVLADNPFANNKAFRPHIWPTGLRNPWNPWNPWRFSFDRKKGDT
jgi:hypothetical protein